jgi:MFS family permease
VVGSLVVGVVSLVMLIVIERRVGNPMIPHGIFKSRAFTLANVLTLFLYAALAEMFFLLPMDLIQARGYTATLAGAAVLPFSIIMFLLSRWSGGLVARVGSRIPLTVGPLVAAAGFALLAFSTSLGSFTTAVLPAVIVTGLGMAVTVAPLTTTVMDSVASEHSGVASGVNNAVSRIAGLIAIAVFGVVVARSFVVRVEPRLARIALSADARDGVAAELPKMAGADVSAIPSLPADRRVEVHGAIEASFNGAFRVAMFGAAALAVAAAVVGFFIVGDDEAPSP